MMARFTRRDGAAGGGTGADPMAFSHDHHRAVLADFLDAIETGREPRVVGARGAEGSRPDRGIAFLGRHGVPQAVRRR